jgi:hypothetical protein
MLKQRRRYPEERFKPWQYTDFYEVETFLGRFAVSMSTARFIEGRLERCSDLEWIEFHDVSGTPRRIQARYISRITHV